MKVQRAAHGSSITSHPAMAGLSHHSHPSWLSPGVVTVALIRAGVYCCGPAPVKAIKEGDMLLKYDIPFIFAEVNADVVYWVVQDDGMQKKSIRSSDVGKYISTKSVGRDSREDITHNYKYPEGMGDFRGRDVPRGMLLLGNSCSRRAPGLRAEQPRAGPPCTAAGNRRNFVHRRV